MSFPNDQPEEADLPHTEWKCEDCGATNSCFDAECQFCTAPPAEDGDEDEEVLRCKV